MVEWPARLSGEVKRLKEMKLDVLKGRGTSAIIAISVIRER